MDFSEFIRAFLTAVKNRDRDFVTRVYGNWFDSAGFPKEQKAQFFHAIFTDLGQLAAASLEREECFGAFCIAHLKDGSGEYSLIFRRKGDSWEYFNERTGFSLFKKVYAIGYVIEGGARPEILFNGEKSPIISELGSSGAVSLINAALKVGENELTILPAGKPFRASIRISSGETGGVIDSLQGDVLSWDGEVKAPVKLKFMVD